MLARDGVILLEREFFRLGTSVLLGDVKKAGVGGRKQFDLKRGGFGHDDDPERVGAHRAGKNRRAARMTLRREILRRIAAATALSSCPSKSDPTRPVSHLPKVKATTPLGPWLSLGFDTLPGLLGA